MMSTERKQILVFSDWFLPGYKAGGPIRSLSNLVSRIDHEFYIVTRNKDHQGTEEYPGITTGEWIRHKPNCFVFYIEEEKISTALFRSIISEKNWDRIYLNSLFSPKFTHLPLRIARSMGKAGIVILAPRGMLQPGALSIKANKKALFLFFAKKFGWFRNIKWHATSEAEKHAIRKFTGENSDIHYAPNIGAQGIGSSTIKSKIPGELNLISIARISPEKGIHAAIEFVRYANLKGKVRIMFYGTQENEAYLNECKTLASAIPEIDISFPGAIEPSHISTLMSESHFFYSATWGENHGHAIVEALQCGVPVIISNRTPWKNLEANQAGWDLELNAESFAPVLVRALNMEQDSYNNLSRHAALLGASIVESEESVKLNTALFE